MAITDATVLNAGTDAVGADLVFLSLHTAAPDGSGSNESAAARQAIDFPAASAGVSTLTNIAFTGGTASGPCTHVGVWSAVTGGTFIGSAALTGDQTFNAAGAYTVTSLTLTGSSS